MTIHFDGGRGASRRYAENRLGGARRSAERLSSGLRIPSAAHDPAGLGLSEALRSRIRSLSGASRNTLEGLDLARVAEGALGEVSELMNRIRELAVQAGSGTLSSTDRASIDDEVRGLVSEIGRIAEGTSFNGVSLLDGSSASVAIQDGIDAGSATELVLTDATIEALGLDGVDLTSAAGAASALGAIDSAIHSVNSARGTFGATRNRLDSRYSTLRESSIELSAAESRLRDADGALETAERSREVLVRDLSSALASHRRVAGERALELLDG